MRRFHSLEDLRIRKRRRRIAESRFKQFPQHNWRSRHPLDCGRPQCGICHSQPTGHPRNWKGGGFNG